MKNIATTLLVFLILTTSILSKDVYAKNIYGLHLTQTEDIKIVSPIINSSQGDWGWVTITIRLDQLNHNQWQDFFNHCRRLHLIPLIRLATKLEEGSWLKPTEQNIKDFSQFLNSLNWPTTDKHIILFNEVNRGDEWGKDPNSQEYANISIFASQRFKKLDPNFIILTAGLDLAAPHTPPNYFGADLYYQEIIKNKPDFFNHIDGLSSHSYPNHGFIGKPSDTGRHSIIGYQWELEYLKNLGVSQKLPVYITETGWPHREGIILDDQFYTTNTTADFLIKAYNIWQKDEQIIAVTPFIFNYPQEPFDHFSWLDKNNNLYPAYNQFINYPKQQNTPSQFNTFQVTKINLPPIIFPNHQYQAKIVLKNTGQTIWSTKDTSFCLLPQSTQNVILSQICSNPQVYTEPGQNQTIEFTLTITTEPKLPKTLIGWQKIEQYFEIKPIIQSIPVYYPKSTFLQNFFKYLIKKFSTLALFYKTS